MKKCLVVSLAGLAISFALPTYAQQKDLADPQTTQKILAVVKTLDQGSNNRDAAAIAGLFTRDAVFVTTEAHSPVGKPFRNGSSCTCSESATEASRHAAHKRLD
jgi:ketosteroid isomerase-like protein